LACFVGVGLAEEGEEACGSASLLASTNDALMEGEFRNHFFDFLQLVREVTPIVLLLVFGVLVETQSHEKR